MLQRARATRQRATLLLSGGPDWTARLARGLVEALPELVPTWLSERPLAPDARGLRAADRLLGMDLDLLVYDAHGGFDPDGFGAAIGALRGGGLLILLTPPLGDWPRRPDPQAARIAVWPHAVTSVGGRFVRRLATLLGQGQALIQLAQEDPASLERALARLDHQGSDSCRVPSSASVDHCRPTEDLARPATPDQASAIDAILAVARGRAHRPLVIRSHRGRGKSAALGLAAARLMHEGADRILITAPRRSSVEAIFRHAQAGASAARSSDVLGAGASHDARSAGTPPLAFWAPADLASAKPSADLVLIDEAAGIPAPILESLLTHYRRLVFATTVHGYEGTGRGFDVRFRNTLDRLAPHWREIRLDQPIRWAAGDPLEALTFRALLLDAAPAEVAQLEEIDPAREHCERLDRDQLADDEPTLRELFGLLVLAHYQTRPMDLRMLLDGPNVRIYVVRRGPHIAATLLAAEEGGLADPALREAIFMGRRRPRGHLLPQTLACHAGIEEATAPRYLRVIRIAVHPGLARRGHGRRLLDRLEQDGRAECFDLLGASFGATPGLVRFWDRCGFRPAQLGTHRNAASGEHAIVVLRALSPVGQGLAALAEARLEARLQVLLAGPLRGLEPLTLTALVAALRTTPGGDSVAGSRLGADDRELVGFIRYDRSFEAALPLLAELTRQRLGEGLRVGAIAPQEAALLIAATRQLWSMPELVSCFGARGREEIMARLRQAAAALIDQG